MIALMTTGANIGGTPVPGLGYVVTTVDDGSQGDGDGYVAGNYELIFISETVDSGNVDPHTDKPIGVVNGEQALAHNRTDRGSMYFSSGANAVAGSLIFNITDNTHPITSLFPLGPTQMYNSGEMGVMQGTIAGAVTVLAYNSQNANEPCLAIADVGATPFDPAIAAVPGADPAPGRRVCLGFHDSSMIDPTLEGAFLFQRVIQWAIGDPVTAGAGQVPDATVTRVVNAPYSPGGLTSITLTASPSAATALDVTETLVTGWTVLSATPSNGVATPAGNTVNWIVDLGTADETMSYIVQAPGSACGASTVTGTFVAGIAGTVGGDGLIYQASDGLDADPDVQWVDSTDIPAGLQPPGSASYYVCDDSYLLRADGADIWDDADEFHFLYTSILGDFQLQGTVEILPPSTDVWTKAGLMLRANQTPGSPHVFAATTNGGPGDPHTGNHDIAFQHRDDQGGASTYDNATEGATNNDEVYFILRRVGTTVYVDYDDGEGNIMIPWQTYTPPNIDPAQVNLVGLALTSHNAGVLANARFTNVAMPVATYALPVITAATRDIQATEYTPGQPITVAIDLTFRSAGTLTVDETVPTGWTASIVSDGGTQNGDVVTWNLTMAADRQISYDITPSAGNQPGQFSGIATDQYSNVVPIGGDLSIRRADAKTVLYIAGTTTAKFATHDANIIAMIGDLGITVGATTIPGLGYSVVVLDENAPEEARNFSPADGNLIYVSETVGSDNVFHHSRDPLPLINGEQALNDDDAPPRSEMYFSEDSGNTPGDSVFDFNIVNLGHPITSYWTATGNVRMFDPPTTAGAAEIGLMRGAIGTGVTILCLAVDPNNPTTPGTEVPCLAVADVGATGFMSPPAGYEPLTHRRVNLGFHNNSMDNPTVDGVIMLQRTFQWAMGDAVTAGEAAPAAPTNLVATSFGADGISLSWIDNSTNESGFKIERSEAAPGSWAEITQTSANISSYADLGLNAGTVYYYRVRAFNPAGDSAYSNEAHATAGQRLDAARWTLYR